MTTQTTKVKLPKNASKGFESAIPQDIKPMLATLVDEPFDKPGWIFEVKWDGYRALAYIEKNNVEIRSRNNKSFNDKFYPIYDALKKFNINAVLDGEIIVVNESGTSDFSALQNWRSEADGKLVYYVFDILWNDGYDLMNIPLKQRRSILKNILRKSNGFIKLSDNFIASGLDFYALSEKMGLEGIIAKQEDSLYSPDVRSREWLKIKTQKRQEFVIGGYTKNEGSSKKFSSLLVGIFKKGKFEYMGKVGTGFNVETQTNLIKQFKPLIIEKCPFDIEPNVNNASRFRPNPPKASAVWLKPQLICEVSYRERTKDGELRHPSFEGMREDKEAADVKLEKEKSTSKVILNNKIIEKKAIKHTKADNRSTFLNPADETQVRIIEGHEIKFTNLSKVFWPKEKYSKRDMLNYYYKMAPYIMPHMKDRVQSLNRFPNGIEGKSFYQKDVTGKVPDWMETYKYYSEKENQEKNYLVCNDEASLLYMAGMGCIEFNPWLSRIQKPNNPDFCIIDLDPDRTTFNQVIKAAQITKQILDAIDVPSYCKTSGSTGLHIYIPLGSKYDYEQSKEFARIIAKLIHTEIPKFSTLERIIANRGGKMYLDFLQNRPHATIAGVYSLRPKPGATVSMPLSWEEVKNGLTMKDFTIKNAPDRVKETGDLFKGVFSKGINLAVTLKKVQHIF